MAKNCLFCKIINKEIPAKIRDENDNWLAIDDIKPQMSTHVLLIPKQHVASLETVSDQKLLADLLNQAKKLAQKLNLKSYRVGINTNPPMQEVMHLHLHLMGK